MMSKPTFQRSTITRVLNAAPELKYVAVYHADDEWLASCIHNYQDRSFVYVLTKEHNEGEHYLYAGKSKAQYARLLQHLQRCEFSHCYIFECQPEHLSNAEISTIRKLRPMYNYDHNPHAGRNRKILGIDYKSQKDDETIRKDLEKMISYEETFLYGFALPGAVYGVLAQKAQSANCTCSELLQTILEKEYTKEIALQITFPSSPSQTNLISAKDYGKLNGKSQEQIKQYCQKGRIPGALRIGRDWVIPRDARFPEDQRKMGAK